MTATTYSCGQLFSAKIPIEYHPIQGININKKNS